MLPWLSTTVERVARLLQQNRLPHALLFNIPQGWGARLFALEVAALLTGTRPAADPLQLVHPDIRWYEPDGAEIKVDAVRALSEFAAMRPQAALRKVACILDAEKLNVQAANALLKTLEEPAADTHIVLVCSTPARLLPTIRSRTQQIQVTLDRYLASAWLAEQGVDAAQARLAEYGGAPLTTMAAVQSGEVALQALLESQEPATLADTLLAQADLGATLARWYRSLPAYLLHANQSKHRDWLRFSGELQDAYRQIAFTNSANARLMVERLAFLWCQLQTGG